MRFLVVSWYSVVSDCPRIMTLTPNIEYIKQILESVVSKNVCMSRMYWYQNRKKSMRCATYSTVYSFSLTGMQ